MRPNLSILKRLLMINSVIKSLSIKSFPIRILSRKSLMCGDVKAPILYPDSCNMDENADHLSVKGRILFHLT